MGVPARGIYAKSAYPRYALVLPGLEISTRQSNLNTHSVQFSLEPEAKSAFHVYVHVT